MIVLYKVEDLLPIEDKYDYILIGINYFICFNKSNTDLRFIKHNWIIVEEELFLLWNDILNELQIILPLSKKIKNTLFSYKNIVLEF